MIIRLGLGRRGKTNVPHQTRQGIGGLGQPGDWWRGNDSGVAYAAYIHPSKANSGAYGGMSFVVFAVNAAEC
jgi:hypothetical protein